MKWTRKNRPAQSEGGKPLPVKWPSADHGNVGESQAIDTRPTTEPLDALGTYSAERARGIQHTPEWQEHMAALERRR